MDVLLVVAHLDISPHKPAIRDDQDENSSINLILTTPERFKHETLQVIVEPTKNPKNNIPKKALKRFSCLP